jgi:nucleoside-diphosphate-sugar epimerase
MAERREMNKILVTGAVGQIGSELTIELRRRYGAENVVATGHRTVPSSVLCDGGPFEFIDVTNRESLEAVVVKYGIDTIYNMAAILSAVGEERPHLAWHVNINGLYNVLELTRERELTRVFWRFNVDVRGVRYPGIISSETLPGGGTTDYAVAIYYEAVAHKHYTCFVREDTVLPLMYMPDCIKGTIDLMEADFTQLKHHADFNLASMSFSVRELAAEIEKLIPGFKCEYEPDFRQAIADSWPRSIDDSAAREEWGWQPDYDLAAMTVDMLDRLGKRHAEGSLYPGEQTSYD